MKQVIHKIIRNLGLLVLGYSSSIMAQKMPVSAVPLDLISGNWKTDPGFQKIIQSAKQSRLVINGENHGFVGFNSRLEVTMMKALYSECGYRNFVIELSPSRAYYLQRFICENDSMSGIYLRSVSSDKFYNFFLEMQKWMQSVPADQRIKIHGIDCERFTDLSLVRLSNYLRTQKSIPTHLFPYVYAVHMLTEDIVNGGLQSMAIENSDYEVGEKKIRGELWLKDHPLPNGIYGNELEIMSLLDSLNAHDQAFKQWLGEGYPEYCLQKQGLEESRDWQVLEGANSQEFWREGIMYQRLRSALEKDTTQKFFGQFGRCHSSYSAQENDCGWYNYHSTVNQLLTKYFKDSSKVVVIGIFYRGESEEISAVNPANNESMRQEVNYIHEVKSKVPVLFDLRMNEFEFPELRKKFQYILLHHESIQGFVDSSKLNSESEESILNGALSGTRINFNFMDLGITQVTLGGMNQHLIDLGANVNPMPKLNAIFNSEISIKRGHYQVGASYFFTGENTLIDNTLYYSQQGGNLNIGYLQMFPLNKSYRAWWFNVLANVGYAEQRVRFQNPLIDMNNPPAVIQEELVNRNFMLGGQTAIGYSFNRNFGVNMKYRYNVSMSLDRWTYSGSELNYATFSNQSAYAHWDLMLGCVFTFR